jgi:hypothetical protein
MQTKTTVVKAKAQCGNTVAEPYKFAKRIGSTQFIVTVRFAENASETMEDKILRLIEREVTKSD